MPFDLLETTDLPAPDFEDSIEQAFLEGQIDSETQALAVMRLERNDGCSSTSRTQAGTDESSSGLECESETFDIMQD